MHMDGDVYMSSGGACDMVQWGGASQRDLDASGWIMVCCTVSGGSLGVCVIIIIYFIL